MPGHFTPTNVRITVWCRWWTFRRRTQVKIATCFLVILLLVGCAGRRARDAAWQEGYRVGYQDWERAITIRTAEPCAVPVTPLCYGPTGMGPCIEVSGDPLSTLP